MYTLRPNDHTNDSYTSYPILRPNDHINKVNTSEVNEIYGPLYSCVSGSLRSTWSIILLLISGVVDRSLTLSLSTSNKYG